MICVWTLITHSVDSYYSSEEFIDCTHLCYKYFRLGCGMCGVVIVLKILCFFCCIHIYICASLDTSVVQNT